MFNPCGHAVTLETARRWTSVRFLPDFLTFHPAAHLLQITPFTGSPASEEQQERHGQCHVDYDHKCSSLYGGTHSICPFCSSVLDPRRPFSKLLMQSESGGLSESDDMVTCNDTDSDDATPARDGTGSSSDDRNDHDEVGHSFLARLRAAGHDLGMLAPHLQARVRHYASLQMYSGQPQTSSESRISNDRG